MKKLFIHLNDIWRFQFFVNIEGFEKVFSKNEFWPLTRHESYSLTFSVHLYQLDFLIGNFSKQNIWAYSLFFECGGVSRGTTFLSHSAWNGRSPSRQMRLISYSGNEKLLHIRWSLAQQKMSGRLPKRPLKIVVLPKPGHKLKLQQ